MNVLSLQRVAFRALLRNKLRSFLTVLGVIIGVAAVIAMMAIGEGAKAQVEQQFKTMGTNLLVVMSGSSRGGGMRGGFGSQPTLTWDDLTAIKTQVPSVSLTAPQLQTRGQVIVEETNWSTQITGTTPEFFEIRSWPVERGAIFGESDVETGTKVVLLGQTVVEKLWGVGYDPIGRIIRVRNVPFEVIGVLGRKGQTPWGQDYDDGVFVPSTTYLSKIQGSASPTISGSIMVSARDEDDIARTQSQITSLLRERHKLRRDAEDDFSIRNMAEVANARAESTKTFTMLLASIALVSLVVGGIGIMNTMLVTVTERTREIGVRMAVGAKPRQIMAQFLVESVTLSVLGGLLGVGLGVGVAKKLAAKFEWPVVIQPDIILLSVAFAAAVGIGFGLYPARKASQLDPIQALRSE